MHRPLRRTLIATAAAALTGLTFAMTSLPVGAADDPTPAPTPAPTGGLGPATFITNPAAAPAPSTHIRSGVLGIATPATGAVDPLGPEVPLGFALVMGGSVVLRRMRRA